MTEADTCRKFVVPLTDYTAEKVRTLCTRPEELRARWADATELRSTVGKLQSLLYAS